MSKKPPLKFAALGLDHRHIYDQTKSLLDIGAQCVGFWTNDDSQPLAGLMERFPQIPRVANRAHLQVRKTSNILLSSDFVGGVFNSYQRISNLLIDEIPIILRGLSAQRLQQADPVLASAGIRRQDY